MSRIILRKLALSTSGDIEAYLAHDEDLLFVVPLNENLVLLVIIKE
jgi:hypothetical protein